MSDAELLEDPEDRRAFNEQSSMTHWWPRLRDLSVPTPATVEVETKTEGEGATKRQQPVEESLLDAVHAVDGPPAFFRADQCSAKHMMDRGSRIDSNEVESNVLRVVDAQMMAMGVPAPKAYYVREWLDLAAFFTAFQGTPIAAELRCFIYNGEIHDIGFYWPQEAIQRPSCDDWKTRLDATERLAFRHMASAREHAQTVASEFDEGYWSVDFALTTHKDAGESDPWYCIDMARGELSWHPESIDPPEEVKADDE